MIRKAGKQDIPALMSLLHQVGSVHHNIRPDLFKDNATKYNERQLEALIDDDRYPIFVFDEDGVQGHAFCQISEISGHRLLQNAKTLYIDDICVDEQARGRHVGQSLYEHVLRYAKSIGCHNITLNVWEGNTPALRFYQHMGMSVQKTGMEVVIDNEACPL